MRLLLNASDRTLTSRARTFVAAAKGLLARGHQVTLACPAESPVSAAATDAQVDLVPLDPSGHVAGDAWGLRRQLQERFIEVVFVHTDREQFTVSSAMRLAERGAVIRRVPAFCPVTTGAGSRLASKLAATGLLFTTEAERARAAGASRIAASVAPLGVDVAALDAVEPVSRSTLGLSSNAIVVACIYEPAATLNAAAVLRSLALLAPRHPNLHLVMMGSSGDHDDVRMHGAALGVNHMVTYLPPSDSMLPVLKTADMAWIVAHHDDGAYGCLHAMGMRIPVIATRDELSQFYVADGITGTLLAESDPALTAATLAPCVGSAEIRKAMGNAGRARVQREFGEAAMIDGFERAADAAADRSRWTGR
ncbi:MAG: glycosyl transferase group 1 [Gemmatimonadetes bacterium]|nr:glycosyl transferase group 1 [Gemmatimonadota bacterium]